MKKNDKQKESLSTGFRDVDKTDINKITKCLSFIDKLKCYESYKLRSIELMDLKNKNIVVDLGCGLGFDVERIAGNFPHVEVIGVDGSLKLIEDAKKRILYNNAKLIHSDIHKLPFDTNSIDCIRIDRALQHVREPKMVISEMKRVLKPGGVMVCIEPDWRSYILDIQDHTLSDKITSAFTAEFKNPYIGSQLYNMYVEENLLNIEIEGSVLFAKDYTEVNTIFDIDVTAHKMNLNIDFTGLKNISAFITLIMIKGNS